jgi:hypothetical protein
VLPLVEAVEARRLFAVTPGALTINAGGADLTDANAQTWAADAGATGGSASPAIFDVSGAADGLLYSNHRAGTSFTYALPMESGEYQVRLHFAEPILQQNGQRVFDVLAEGSEIVTDLDLHAVAGTRVAIVREATLEVIDGTLNLQFTADQGNAVVSAIEVNYVGPASDPLSEFTQINWSNLNSPSPISRIEATRAVIDGKLYVFGGFSGVTGPSNRADVYDPATNSWTQLATMPERITHTGVAAVGRDIYFAGAYIGNGINYNQIYSSVNVWRYNVDTNTYTATVPLPEPRAGGGLVHVDGYLYFFGGGDDTPQRTDRAETWRLKVDGGTEWEPLADMPDARNHLGYFDYAGKVWAIGGQHSFDEDLETRDSFHMYDPETNTWTAKAPIPVPLSHIGSTVFTLGSRAVVVGGESDHLDARNEVLAYDFNTDTWTELTALPVDSFSGVAVAIDGVIYHTAGNSGRTTYAGQPML